MGGRGVTVESCRRPEGEDLPEKATPLVRASHTFSAKKGAPEKFAIAKVRKAPVRVGVMA